MCELCVQVIDVSTDSILTRIYLQRWKTVNLIGCSTSIEMLELNESSRLLTTIDQQKLNCEKRPAFSRFNFCQLKFTCVTTTYHH